jgi:hypothetical protein
MRSQPLTRNASNAIAAQRDVTTACFTPPPAPMIEQRG